MRNSPVPLRLVNLLFRRGLWLGTAATILIAPKCLVCVIAYAGLGAAIGIGGTELCGGPTDSPLARATLLSIPALGVCVVILSARMRNRVGLTHNKTPDPHGPASLKPKSKTQLRKRSSRPLNRATDQAALP